MPTRFQPGDPEFLSRARIESPEAAVACAGNENEVSRGCDGSPQTGNASFRNPFSLQLVNHSERNFPGDLARVQVNCVEGAPGRLLAGVMVFVPKTGV